MYGSAEEYNRWAELVGDENWSWENTKEDFKKVFILFIIPQSLARLRLTSVLNQIENYATTRSTACPKYANPKPEDHGQNG